MKNDYLNKLAIRIKQKANLLIARPNFQKDIILLRAKWAIPPKGFTNTKSYQLWYTKLCTDTANYYSKTWPKEKQQIIDLRKKGEFEQAEEIRKKISVHAPFNQLKNDVWSLVRTYALSQHWYEGMQHYLLLNDPKLLYRTEGLKVQINWEHGIKQCLIEFDDDTTLPDLKHAWSWARKMKSGKPTAKFREIENFDRDKRAYELRKERKTDEEILTILETEFGDVLEYNHLNIIIARYKKRINIK